MLVLSRRVGEQLIIGDDVRVVIHAVRGNRVVVGIAAPNDVVIRRGEIPPYPRKEASDAEGSDASNS